MYVAMHVLHSCACEGGFLLINMDLVSILISCEREWVYSTEREGGREMF